MACAVGEEGLCFLFFFFPSRSRHTRLRRDWSSDVCSSDLTLDDVQIGDEVYRIVIRAQEGVSFVTRFVGTRIVDGSIGPVGETLAEQEGLGAVYRPKGDELYIRAVVTSSRLHPNPYAQGDREMAWAQPWVL